ncbi:Unknown protein, partial [Striga hermonthica]
RQNINFTLSKISVTIHFSPGNLFLSVLNILLRSHLFGGLYVGIDFFSLIFLKTLSISNNLVS